MVLDGIDMKKVCDAADLSENQVRRVIDALEKNGFTPARKVPPEYVQMDIDLPGRNRPDQLTKKMLVEEIALAVHGILACGPLPVGIFNTFVDKLDSLGLRIATQDPKLDEDFQEMMEHDNNAT